MKLKKMEILGFKSFSDKSSIEFPRGVSAIVGPNGCGKSNIVDALRWAMGEQSVKQLRGKSMEDVIFAGADDIPPQNLAEVSLTLLNDNGSAPDALKDFTEIQLTRRLYRSGESGYFINKQACRLKDIHNVFLGSGMGAKSYAVIQQGNIGAITEAGPEERRSFIEEAAGTTRYKDRKKESLRKLEDTNQNLLRVKDIIAEVERQMNGLKRQARKAERYKNYRERIKELDIRISLHQYETYSQEIHAGDELLKSLRDQDVEQSVHLKKLDAAVEEIRLRQSKQNQEITELKSERFQLQREIDRAENDLSHLQKEGERLSGEAAALEKARDALAEKNRNMIEEMSSYQERNRFLEKSIEEVRVNLSRERGDSQNLRDRLTAHTREREEGKSRLMELAAQEARYKNILETTENSKAHIDRRLKRTDEEVALGARQVAEGEKSLKAAEEAAENRKAEIAAVSERIDALRTQLQGVNQSLADQVKQVQRLEYDRNRVRSDHAALKKMAENFEWYRDGVKAVLKRETAEKQVLGVVADILDPEPSYEAAVEAVLGEALQYILVADQNAARDAIGYLRDGNEGRGGFIPIADLKSSAVDSANLDFEESGGEVRRLLDHVTVKPGYEQIADGLLGRVGVVADLDTASTLFNRNGRRRTYVTSTGDLVTAEGILAGGSPETLSGILAKKQELKALEQRLGELDESLSGARDRQKEVESKIRELETELHRQTEAKNRAVTEEMEDQKRVFKATEELKHARRRLETLQTEQEQLLEETDSLDEKLEQYRQSLAEVTDAVRKVQASVSQVSEKIDAVSAEAEAFEERIVDLKLKLTSLNAELENSTHSLRRLKSFQEDGLTRLAEMERDIDGKKRRRDASAEEIKALEKSLTGRYDRMKGVEARLAERQSVSHSLDEQLQESDRSISEVQGRREDLLQKVRMLEMEQSQRRMRQENVASRMEERYHRPIAAFRREWSGFGEEKPMSPEKMEAELASLRSKIDRIGEVNLGAIAEYDQYKERHAFLCTQRDDLLKAMDDLHQVIRKINRITQDLFMSTFNRINEKLQEVFPRLFDGGAAQLVLTEPEKPLETGVEFMVSPPGKKLTRMSLLSGGEKALSAIAFVFSIFLIKPASFCILDEIDAPLDDANVLRFNALLKIIGENSQIIMITHKRKSMEFADTLFGITMERRGISKIVSVNFDRVEETL